MGDFYETFDADAELVSRVLGIVLTSKPLGPGLRVPLAGVPVAAAEGHLARLIRAGHRVAICEQLEEPRATKGLVARGVVRVLSPGTALAPALLEGGRNNYCAALSPLLPGAERDGDTPSAEGGVVGLAAIDLSTGEFRVCELAGPEPAREAAAELARLGPAELLLAAPPAPASPDPDPLEAALAEALPGERCARALRPAEQFRPRAGAEELCRHYAVADVEGLGLAGRAAAVAAAGALLRYLRETQSGPDGPDGSGGAGPLAHLERPRLYEPGATMRLDPATVRALDLFPRGRAEEDAGARPSLLELLDRTRTAPGRRLLRRRLTRPLLDLERIEERLARVALLVEVPLLREGLGQALAPLPDLERLLSRAVAGLAAPPEVAALGRGLAAAAALVPILERAGAERDPPTGAEAASGDGEAAAQERPLLLARVAAELRPCAAAQEAIAALLEAEPAAAFEDGGVVRAGADAEADRQRACLHRGRAAIAALETRERGRSGIANLRVGYHRTFGYYLEVSKSGLGRVPPNYERRQTLAGGERFVTPELRTLEAQVLQAREALTLRERALFQDLCRGLGREAAAVRALARGVARLDVACALAEVALARGYVRPRLDRSPRLLIREGRHPLVEAALEAAGAEGAAGGGAGRFVPNDLDLSADGAQVLVLTGPNMAGKSTYLRQAALIVLMAQCGGFVPAAEARIGLVDRIFARVGAQDHLAAGRSTFLVEMLETSAILATATERSLLVLDEIGRGTSTYDGLAIARALLEHLAAAPERGPRTLFATHFHELTALAEEQGRVHNASVAVRAAPQSLEGPGGGKAALRFLYRIVPGGADRSYGLEVARMAGLPAPLLARAARILERLEGRPDAGRPDAARPDGSNPDAVDAPAVPPDPSALALELAALDVDALTPLEAISALYALRRRAQEECQGWDGPADLALERPAERAVPS